MINQLKHLPQSEECFMSAILERIHKNKIAAIFMKQGSYTIWKSGKSMKEKSGVSRSGIVLNSMIGSGKTARKS